MYTAALFEKRPDWKLRANPKEDYTATTPNKPNLVWKIPLQRFFFFTTVIDFSGRGGREEMGEETLGLVQAGDYFASSGWVRGASSSSSPLHGWMGGEATLSETVYWIGWGWMVEGAHQAATIYMIKRPGERHSTTVKNWHLFMYFFA